MNTIRELIDSFSKKDGTALSSRNFSISYKELHDLIVERGRKLLSIGLAPGDRVILLAENSPEWFIWNLSITYAGLIDVPRGEYTTPSEVSFILKHSGARAAIVQNEKFLEMINRYPHDKLEFTIGMKKLPETIDLDQQKAGDFEPFIPQEDDIVSIIYTSGTTGDLKGVMLTHKNFLSNGKALLRRVDLNAQDKLMSILPAWHVYERIIKYCTAIAGSETFYSSSRTLLSDLAEQNPTIMGTVPRFWELIYNTIQKQLKGSGLGAKLKRGIVRNALDRHKIPFLNISSMLAKHMIFPKIKKIFGQRFRYAISGGGALPKHIEDMFAASGIKILEGYGMTETSPVIAVRPPGYPKSYTVGPPLDNVEIKIIDPEHGHLQEVNEIGVIYVKAPSVMKGYYRDYEQTSKSIRDDYLDTGDLGYLDDEGFLVITGRYKELIVLSSGENIQPAPIERALSESPYIGSAIIVGQDWKNIGALIVPEFETLKNYCQDKKIEFDPDKLSKVLSNEKVKDLYRKEFKRLIADNEDFKAFENIRTFELLEKPFELGCELTATMKPRRHVITELYKQQLAAMRDQVH
jgi:long-chain acyl-CoA synthetase